MKGKFGLILAIAVFIASNVYADKCVSGNCVNGHGTMIKTSGDKYIGNFKDGKMHGKGTMMFANGRKYIGEWKNGKRNGQGTYLYPTGARYVGGWKDGKRHGQGTAYRKDGSIIFKGRWENGEQVK